MIAFARIEFRRLVRNLRLQPLDHEKLSNPPESLEGRRHSRNRNKLLAKLGVFVQGNDGSIVAGSFLPVEFSLSLARARAIVSSCE